MVFPFVMCIGIMRVVAIFNHLLKQKKDGRSRSHARPIPLLSRLDKSYALSINRALQEVAKFLQLADHPRCQHRQPHRTYEVCDHEDDDSVGRAVKQ